MLLADFIKSHNEAVLAAWEDFARGLLPGSKMDTLALRDHAPAILTATVHDMNHAQTSAQRSARSKDHEAHDDHDVLAPLSGASEEHAIGRLGSGFSLMEVVAEYRALRASVLGLWRDSGPAPHERDVDDLTRFNESLDHSLAKAVACYTQRVDQSRDMFLAILSHDLRNPLNAIAMSAQLLAHIGKNDVDAAQTTAQICTSASVMERMISDLLDYTRTRLGAGLPVSPEPIDVSELCRAVYEEFHSAHPERAIHFRATGDLMADGDTDRLRQAVSNLMGNAVQHGSPEFPVALTLTGEATQVHIAVHNGGPAIPAAELPKIFQPLVRGSGVGKLRRSRPGSIGLGLYIAREIATSHGGSLGVTSTDDTGTTFTLRLPRHTLKVAGPIMDEEQIRNM